jgi:hypothetical protein
MLIMKILVLHNAQFAKGLFGRPPHFATPNCGAPQPVAGVSTATPILLDSHTYFTVLWRGCLWRGKV